MGLSDEERRRLERLEQELAAADPDLAQKLAGPTCSRAASTTLYGVMAATAGFAMVTAGIITQNTIVGITGFLLMIGAVDWSLNRIRPQPTCPRSRHGPRAP
ncbi:DUF3040 domain-containing protein [Pseudarthrobacter phenanthrenivorans]|uniref:DUF3040 domain-containing protein n=1 Tax=Pseudarthrobacter phenanthrenivorans TaxID=361575 RepID=UPI00344DEC3D